MHVFTQHIQWDTVQNIVTQLKANGFQALLAGGCVRDLLMQRTPHDFDIATNAHPDQVAALFPKALTVGREFGVTILPYAGFHVEVATFRTDGPYVDGRRPTHIAFSSPEEDARRRDFTVNALFFDLATQTVIDYVGGQDDIRARVIRAVGDPEKRFNEDKLRILRAVRFAAQLEFSIAAPTMEAIQHQCQHVEVVAAERVHDELVKLLLCPGSARGLQLLSASGLLPVVLPEIAPGLARPDLMKCVEARLQCPIPAASKSVPVVLLQLLYDFFCDFSGDHSEGLAPLQALLKRLKFANSESSAVIWVLQMRDLYLNPLQRRRSEVIRALAQPVSSFAEEFYGNCVGVSAEVSSFWREIHAGPLGGKRELPARFVNGDDLLRLGIARGARLGQILDEAFNLQLEGQFTDRPAALAWATAQKK